MNAETKSEYEQVDSIGTTDLGLRITDEDVVTVQHQWADGIVEIGEAFSNGDDFVALAGTLVDTLYAYEFSPVLFKPTLACEQPFRLNAAEALSYFVAANGACPEDHGFAIRPWVSVRFENAGIVTSADTAFAMGHYSFTDAEGAVTEVEYTFGYIRDPEGNLRINLHHSSMPFSPQGVAREEDQHR